MVADIRRSRSWTKGFTLIELLVVVAVIAILIGIIMPAISRARDIAKIALCASNQRQILTALHTYSNENKNMGPAYRGDCSDSPRGSGGFNPAQYTNVNYFGGVTEAIRTTSPLVYWMSPDVAPRKLNSYVSGLDVFKCPADVGKITSFTGTLPPNEWSKLGSSYYYNSNWYGGAGTPAADATTIQSAPRVSPWVLYNQPYASVRDPAKQVALGDGGGIQYSWPFWPGGITHGTDLNWHDPPRYHLGAPPGSLGGGSPVAWYYDPKANMGFLDGHVKFIKIGPYTTSLAVNGKGYNIDPKWNP